MLKIMIWTNLSLFGDADRDLDLKEQNKLCQVAANMSTIDVRFEAWQFKQWYQLKTIILFKTHLPLDRDLDLSREPDLLRSWDFLSDLLSRDLDLERSLLDLE